MANELTVQNRIASTKANATVDSGSLSGTADVSGLDVDGGVSQNIGTTDEQLAINPEIGTIGWLLVKNEGVDSTGASTTKYVTLSYDTGGSFDTYKFAEIPAGLSVSLRPSFPTGKTAIYAESESGATNGVQVRKWVVGA